MKQIIIILLTLATLGCTRSRQSDINAPLNIGDSITTIDSVSYYWMQVSDDSARISAVKDGRIINECLVTGPINGAAAIDEEPYGDRFFYILCGEDQYELFDTKHMPSEMNLFTEEDLENYDIGDEDADLVINL